VARRCVRSSNLVRDEAKARLSAVKYTPTKGCVAPGAKNLLEYIPHSLQTIINVVTGGATGYLIH
jgi:hypothetical protein